MIYRDGTVYEGEWKYCMEWGKGKKIHTNGKVQEGDWEKGEFKSKGFLSKLFRK